MKIKKMLLASHGTPGARAAEDLALELCRESGAALYQLFVVPDFWKGMMGDDWLNNAVTQARFGDYVESQLAREAAEEIARFAKEAEKAGVSLTEDVRVGKPAACLIEACEQTGFDLVVIGSPRPKGAPGLRSRMDLEQLTRALTTRLIIAPCPR
jgi:nucleotide-binding universal stress UspA family protein